MADALAGALNSRRVDARISTATLVAARRALPGLRVPLVVRITSLRPDTG
jgi:hypothetical protein